MKCRMDIKGQKIWVDNNNLYNTRPPSTEMILSRDGEIYKTATVESTGDGTYTFACLPIWKNSAHKYIYRVDEREVPADYTKTIQGYSVRNTLNAITISGVKTWIDNNNQEGYRPASIMVSLLRNGDVVGTIEVLSPPDAESTVAYTFGEMPFADAQGVPYVYTVDEGSIDNYIKTTNGFNITNTVRNPFTPFSFVKSSARTGAALRGASFEIRKNGSLIETAVSDKNGIVSFSIPEQGTFQLLETQPPAGFMDDITVHQVVVSQNGTVSVDGQPASEFSVNNQPTNHNLPLSRATNSVQAYMDAPNTWPLHGIGPTELFMTDKILIAPQINPVTVKWDYGVKDAAHFSTGGYDITGSYASGIPVETNGDYTVYALFGNGDEATDTIKINRIRDGSAEMPYLLIDFATAERLEPSITGIGQFTPNYMQGGGKKLAQSYELFENIDMTGKPWSPLGTIDIGSPPFDITEGFSGSLEGNGHTMNGLALKADQQYVPLGLFRVVVDGAVIQNFGVSYNIEGKSYVAMAAVVSVLDGGTVSFKNVRISNSTLSNDGVAGGLLGYSQVENGSLNIDQCGCVNLEINNSTSAGGLMGSIIQAETGLVSITNCSSDGSIQNMSTAGGIVGRMHNPVKCSIINCVNGMSLVGTSNLGGIIGNLSLVAEVSNLLTISSCYNRGNITGTNYCGAIIGQISGSMPQRDIIIENCYNSGTIRKNATKGAYVSNVGGLVGASTGIFTVRNSYNVGDVIDEIDTGGVRVGGISGNYGEIQNCAVINREISSSQAMTARISPTNIGSGALNNNVAFDNMKVLIKGVQKTPLAIGSTEVDGINVSAAEIKTQALYKTTLGWDFDNVWSFGNGAYTLPVLRGIPLDVQPDILPLHLV